MTILTPTLFVVAIPSLIVLFRFVRALVHIQNYPRHLIHAQWGRFLYFVGFCMSFAFHFMIATDIYPVPKILAILPVCTFWFISIPLLCSRIRGLSAFVKKWHERMTSEHQSRLLVWKANMLKAQIIAEIVAYTLLTFLFLSIHSIVFYQTYRITFICSSL